KSARHTDPKRFFLLKRADGDCPARPPWPYLRYPIPFELHFRIEIGCLAGPNFSIGDHFNRPTHGVRVRVRAGVGNSVEKGHHILSLAPIDRPTVWPLTSLEHLHHGVSSLSPALAFFSEAVPEFLHGITLHLFFNVAGSLFR